MRAVYPALYYGGEGHALADKIGSMTHVHDDSRLSVMAYHRTVADLTGTDNSIEWGKEQIEYHIKPVRELIDETKLKPSGYAPESLVCAANAIKNTSGFEDAIIYAVNLGGDADTIGAITGGLAGALYGAKNIPLRWINALANEPNGGKRNADNFMARMLTDLAQIAYAERTGKPMAAVQFGEESIKKYFEKF
jgi:ADP-ribosyl-[dinitrogen reductase] hydrolase